MRAPLLIPALLLLDAIVLSRSERATLAIAGITVATVLVWRKPAQLLAAAAVACGLLLGMWHAAPSLLEHEIRDVTVSGIVASEIDARAWGDTFLFLGDDGRRYAVTLRDAAETGENLVVRGDLEPFDEARNPGEPPARDFARERGLVARISHAAVVARGSPDRLDLRTVCPRIRTWANAALHRLLAEPDATILAGMLYGSRGTLPADLRAEFQDTGTVHVLVTAGLHLGVVAGIVTFVFSLLRIGRVPAALGAIPLIWAYAAVSGAHVPSLRAATMVTVALLARALGEGTMSLNTLALAAIAVAAIWPAWVGGASFGLSFSCVGAIVLFAEPISNALQRLQIPAPLREALALTLATQIGVWPLTAATFLVIAPYAPLANLFVVPIVGIALLGGIVMLILSPFAPLASIVAHIEAWPLAWIESVVHLTARLPGAHVVATPPPAWTLACYDLAIVVAGMLVQTSSKRGITAP